MIRANDHDNADGVSYFGSSARSPRSSSVCSDEGKCTKFIATVLEAAKDISIFWWVFHLSQKSQNSSFSQFVIAIANSTAWFWSSFSSNTDWYKELFANKEYGETVSIYGKYLSPSSSQMSQMLSK